MNPMIRVALNHDPLAKPAMGSCKDHTLKSPKMTMLPGEQVAPRWLVTAPFSMPVSGPSPPPHPINGRVTKLAEPRQRAVAVEFRARETGKTQLASSMLDSVRMRPFPCPPQTGAGADASALFQPGANSREDPMLSIYGR